MPVLGLIFVRSGVNLVVFGVIFGVLSYVRTQRFKQRTGVNPWGVPPPVWGVLSVFIAVFGTLLSVIACATTRPRQGTFGAGPGYGPPGYGPPGYGPPGYGPPGYGPTPGVPGSAPAYGTPGAGLPGPTAGGPPPGPGTLPAATWGAPGTPGGPPAGPGTATPSWHPDPTGRHQHRYWDGARWTEHVSTGGTAALDPV